MTLLLSIALPIVWAWVLWCIIKGKLLREEAKRYTWDRIRGFGVMGLWLTGIVLIVTGFVGAISGYNPDLQRVLNGVFS